MTHRTPQTQTDTHTVYESFEYDGGENFLRRNFRMYSGRQETSVMTSTFHRKSHDQMNSQSERKGEERY